MLRCFLIAEAGINHNGDLALAKCLVDAAQFAGADAVKFQTYKTETICNPGDDDWDMLKKHELSFDDFKRLADYCRSVGIEFMSTPECPETLIFLVSQCGMGKLKIGSGDLTNHRLLKYASGLRIPIYLSTGMATVREISAALSQLSPDAQITLMHCVSLYPTCVDEANLKAIKTLQYVYKQHNIGYSDHTLGDIAPLAAVAMGARAIEKHITLDVRMNGPDHQMSMEPSDFQEMVRKIRQLERMLGTGEKIPCEEELEVAKRVRKGADGKRGIAT